LSQTENSDYQDLISQCDALIKAGKMNQVATLIARLNFSRVPRPLRQGLAKICRRAVLISHGLRLLQPIIRNENPSDEPATGGEICEYAVLLLVNGSVREALELLATVDSKTSPEAFMYQGFCEISQWECGKGAQSFEHFLNATQDEYSKLIARVNLASCYAATFQLEKAAELLAETIELAEKAGAKRLVGNCHELSGQVYFWQNDFAKAREACAKALGIFGEAPSYDQLLVCKTEAVMKALETKSLKPLTEFRELAVTRKHWSCVREADLFSVKVQFHQKNLDHVVFGTAMPMYRQRIEQVVGANPSESYIYGSDKALLMDLRTGKFSRGKKSEVSLNAGKKNHQVLAALLKDFYVPVNSGTLFSELYPEEYYNSESSPFRINQLILRVRSWLKENKIPASIEQFEGSYRLAISGQFGIQLEREASAIDSFAVRLQELKTTFAEVPSFSGEEVRQKLNWSKSMFHRVSDWALKNGELEKSGQGRSTQYQVKESQSSDGSSATFKKKAANTDKKAA
jgi:tetratricopeptide (TPR) repeat protein